MDSDATSANASDVDGDMDLDATTDKVARAIALALKAIPVIRIFISISFQVHTRSFAAPGLIKSLGVVQLLRCCFARFEKIRTQRLPKSPWLHM